MKQNYLILIILVCLMLTQSNIYGQNIKLEKELVITLPLDSLLPIRVVKDGYIVDVYHPEQTAENVRMIDEINYSHKEILHLYEMKDYLVNMHYVKDSANDVLIDNFLKQLSITNQKYINSEERYNLKQKELDVCMETVSKYERKKWYQKLQDGFNKFIKNYIIPFITFCIGIVCGHIISTV